MTLYTLNRVGHTLHLTVHSTLAYTLELTSHTIHTEPFRRSHAHNKPTHTHFSQDFVSPRRLPSWLESLSGVSKHSTHHSPSYTHSPLLSHGDKDVSLFARQRSAIILSKSQSNVEEGGERGGGFLCDATGAVVIQFVNGRVWKLSELNCTEGHSPLCCTGHNSIV